MFSRFKEKLSGFKEALSSKIAEKVTQAEKIAGKVNDRPDELISGDEKAVNGIPAKAISPPEEKSTEVKRSSPSSPSASPESPLAQEKADANNKPKSRFSFLEKAKSLIFEQEVILEEKDLEEP
ncbi:MAG: signal recognition particle-docking protein FtsY, partial [Methanothrix sp.]|nr:signal recognition particle-docking protein FtsY [Methanothrix sp.]